jgi:hypothetical protein
MAISVSGVDSGARLSAQGAFADLRAMPEELREELRGIAGTNQVIRGAALEAVFTKLDHAAMRTPANRRVLDALKAHVEENRARAEREGWQRFQGDADLERIAAGQGNLAEGTRGKPVEKVQQALIDTGYSIGFRGASGNFDRDTRAAVERFQRDAGLPVTGRIDQETLTALAAFAPPPGQQIERFAEWDRVWGDRRADVTIALDDSHDAERNLFSGLKERGFRPLETGEILSMSDESRRELGLTDDRFDPTAMYFVRSHEGEHAVVRLISPDPTDDRRASLARAMRQDEVVIYSGNGTGASALDPAPKVEAATTGLGRSARRSNDDGGRPAYQLMIFSGRSPELPGRSISDTDVIALTNPAHFSTSGARALGFLDGVLARSSNNQIIAEQSSIIKEHLRHMGFEGDPRLATGTYGESGFLANSGNRRVAATAEAK